jgi:nucleoside-diphosphate-sugar epimerase
MRVLITGITGFIGQRLARALHASGRYELVGMARDQSKGQQLEAQGIEIRYADLLNVASLQDVTRDVDVVLHLAALMDFHASWERLYRHNVVATQVIARDAMRHGVDYFIYASSTEAVGPVNQLPADETARCQPVYDYGKTKLIVEQWLHTQHVEHGFPMTLLRPTGVYGPGDTYVTLSTVQAVADRKLRMLPGGGDCFVHFTYIDDTVQGFIRALEAPQTAIGEVFTIASDDYYTYRDTFTIIAELVGVPPPRYAVPLVVGKAFVGVIEWINAWRGIDDFVMHTSVVEDMATNRAYSNQKAKNQLGFQPTWDLTTGMEATIAGFRDQMLL